MSRTRHHNKRIWVKKTPYWKWWSSPGWWVREMMTRPQRAKTRELINEVKKLDDLENAPEFPLARKPHIYYW